MKHRPLIGSKIRRLRKRAALTQVEVAAQLGISPDEVEQRDFAPDSPRGNAICRMVDASEIAFLTVFLASQQGQAVTGELISANGGVGNSVYY